MDHIRQHDWCSSGPDVYFLNENDIDNSVTEKILRNKFFDPLISSESEDDGQPEIKINWSEIFNKNKSLKTQRIVVPGIHPVPQFPKLSALNSHQHYQCLKVLCAQNPHILPAEFLPRPTKQDHRVFEELKEIYAKEQKEYIEWAKSLWTSSHCVRALRPKPPIEMVYEAEFKVTAHEMQSFPKNYTLAAQIPLETPNAVCELVAEKELISVSLTLLPKITIPDMSERVFIMKPYPVPEPCSKHPCRFLLPSESTMTLLPLTEVHKELAQYAMDNGAQHIASEEALRCLMELDRQWTLAFSVCNVLGPEGEARVVVLGGEVSSAREPALSRTRKAFRRLLQHALAPPIDLTAKKKAMDSKNPGSLPSYFSEIDSSEDDEFADDDDDDGDDDHLYIDTDTEEGDTENESAPKKTKKDKKPKNDKPKKTKKKTTEPAMTIDYFECTCKDMFDKPPRRSYRKWKVINKTTNDKYDLIVHCPHRVRGPSGEVILEAIPEYQIDLGGSQLSDDTLRSQALALMLRKNASILNVRIDSASGEIVTCAPGGADVTPARGDVTARLHAALEQLQGLMPGHYVLQHEATHGANALLYRPGAGDHSLQLSWGDSAAPRADDDEARHLRAPPHLTPTLLPVHKYRKILPCAFSPFPNHLARETRRPNTRQKTPPQAIKWPKRRNKKKKNNNSGH